MTWKTVKLVLICKLFAVMCDLQHMEMAAAIWTGKQTPTNR